MLMLFEGLDLLTKWGAAPPPPCQNNNTKINMNSDQTYNFMIECYLHRNIYIMYFCTNEIFNQKKKKKRKKKKRFHGSDRYVSGTLMTDLLLLFCIYRHI